MLHKNVKTITLLCATTIFQACESLLVGDLVARLHVALPERRLALPRDHEHRLLRHVRNVEGERALTDKYVILAYLRN